MRTAQTDVADTASRDVAAGAVEHPTMEARAARGRAARDAVPRSDARCLGARSGTSRPDRAARGPGGVACPRARPDPVRPHVGVAVHVLPWSRHGDGGRPGDQAAHELAHPAVRRRPPLQLRCVRGAGSAARVQRQRLRRDAARSVRVGRDAARRQLRRRRQGSRLRHDGAGEGQPDRRPRLPRVDARPRQHEDLRPVVHPCRRRRAPQAMVGSGRQVSAHEPAAQHRQSANQRQPPSSRQADTRRRRQAPDHRRPTIDHPRRRPPATRPTRPVRGVGPHDAARATGGRCPATAAASSSASTTSTRHARSSAWAASAPERGSPS